MLAINLPEFISLGGGNLYQYFGCTTPTLDDGFIAL